jgi:hypothetical protein
MPKVIYITSPNEIPAEQKYILVIYGEEYGQTRHPVGLTITVAHQQSKTVSDLSFLTAVHTARRSLSERTFPRFMRANSPTPRGRSPELLLGN